MVNEPIPVSLNSEMTIDEYGQNTLNESDVDIDDLGPLIMIKVTRNANDQDETMQPGCWKLVAE